jgi:hypothetical protein
MNIVKRINCKGDKAYFSIEFSRKVGARMATGIFIYTHPKDQVEKNHNKEALILIATKKSELLLEQQAIGTGFIPVHKFKANFLQYYKEYVDANRRTGCRHLSNSFTQFKLFLKTDFIAPIDITETLCKKFRQFLLDNFTGETPANYFLYFKQVIKAGTKDSYWRYNPAEDVKSRKNPVKRLKENLEV